MYKNRTCILKYSKQILLPSRNRSNVGTVEDRIVLLMIYLCLYIFTLYIYDVWQYIYMIVLFSIVLLLSMLSILIFIYSIMLSCKK